MTLDSLGAGPTLTTDGVEVEGGAHIQLAGRQLTCVVGLRLRSTQGVVIPLGVDDLYSLLLAKLCAVRDTCDAVASALGSADLARPSPWSGWVRARSNYRLTQVVNFERFERDGAYLPVEAVLVPMKTPANSDPDLEQLCREWLTVMLLDIGMRDFEGWLEQVPQPAWFVDRTAR